MKLVRFGEPGKEETGIFLNGHIYNTSSFGEDYNETFFASSGIERLQSFIATELHTCTIVDPSVRLGPPVARPSKILCIGLNYAVHAKETNAPVPKEPILFMKSTTAIVGPDDDVMIPRDSVKTDWEVELCVVIGKKASYVTEEDAMDHVAGYCLHNDISEREFQLERGGTWDKGKGCDTFAPLGPWMVTRDEIPDPHNLRLWLRLNGKIMQDSNTNDFVFNVPQLISYISRFMTLLPGDIISTGTPSGVGLGFNPPLYLKPGDVMELGIDGLGEARQHVKAYHAH
jgi:2,4-diketo-3-deoxy-L-fuconate hydrolase